MKNDFFFNKTNYNNNKNTLQLKKWQYWCISCIIAIYFIGRLSFAIFKICLKSCLRFFAHSVIHGWLVLRTYAKKSLANQSFHKPQQDAQNINLAASSAKPSRVIYLKSRETGLPKMQLPKSQKENRFFGISANRPEQCGIPARRQGASNGSVLPVHDRCARRSQQRWKPQCEGYIPKRNYFIYFIILPLAFLLSLSVTYHYLARHANQTSQTTPQANAFNTGNDLASFVPLLPIPLPFDTTQKVRDSIDNYYAAVTIHHSIYLSGKKSGLSTRLIANFIRIFNGEINFSRNVYDGDKMVVLYKKQPVTLHHKKVMQTKILAAELITRKKTLQAIGFTNAKGHTNYYTPKGLSVQASFLRAPIHYRKITSLFSYHRWHPILHIYCAHLGVDFAAPLGTPIKATGNGRIIFRGRKGGYGNVVMIKHNYKYTTLYAHMEGFVRKLHLGSYVHKGQTIGYLGSTGLSTGPHVHYEFRIYGKQHNPLKVNLPHLALSGSKNRHKFFAQVKILLAKLNARYPQFAEKDLEKKTRKAA